MRRRRRTQTSDASRSDHHNVYVVLLDDAVNSLRKVSRANPGRDPAKPSVYVLVGQQSSPGYEVANAGPPLIYRWSRDVEAQAARMFPR